MNPSTDIILSGNNQTTSLISSDVDRILSKQIIFKNWYFRTSFYVTAQPVTPDACMQSVVNVDIILTVSRNDCFI